MSRWSERSDRVVDQPRRVPLQVAQSANGKVSGPGGGAQLLGLKSTTFASRIKALGIVFPKVLTGALRALLLSQTLGQVGTAAMYLPQSAPRVREW